MVRLTRIITRTGDDGTTGLASGPRRRKDDARVEAIGAVDEANAAIGVARAHLGAGAQTDALLAAVQNDLFDLGADLATPPEGDGAGLRIVAAQVERLERATTALNADLAPLTSFVLPAGTPAAAHLHLARTITRRAERRVVALAAAESVAPEVVHYLNRLSDLLFVAARAANGAAGDVVWQPAAGRNQIS